MFKQVLIVGAGPGLSLASARRFGGDGYTVHLVARSAERLDALASSLREDGIETEVSAADVGDHARLTELVREIDGRRPVDVCLFQPGVPASALVDALHTTVADVRPHVAVQVLGAVAVSEALVPKMLERDAGALVFIGGGSARMALPAFGNLGMAMAGLRTHALTLGAALEDTGVYSGFFTIGGMIGGEQSAPGELDPTVLAERLHRLVDERDVRELIMTPKGEVIPKGATR
jgi:short-subunit dehydrogenase